VKIVVTAAACVVLAVIFKRAREVIMLALPLIVEAAAFITTTAIVGRPRPEVERLDDSPVSSSFPSGHVAAATCYGAVAIVIAWHTRHRWLPVLAVVLTAVVVGLVAWARWYRGMHHVSDIVAGVLLGLASVVGVWLIVRAGDRRRHDGATDFRRRGASGRAWSPADRRGPMRSGRRSGRPHR
jgi:membrane-associated phospholipid phosphatase